MKNGDIITITLDYDKNIYVSPNRGTVNLTNVLNLSAKHIVDEDLHQTLIETRELQWNKKKAASGRLGTGRTKSNGTLEDVCES
jgi:hypothetical protein